MRKYGNITWKDFAYEMWRGRQSRYADIWEQRLKIFKKTNWKPEPFDPDKKLACCIRCHKAFWGQEKRCPSCDSDYKNAMNRYKLQRYVDNSL